MDVKTFCAELFSALAKADFAERIALQVEGFQTAVASSGSEGLAILEKETYDLVLLDLKMPGKNGYDVLKELEDNNIHLRVIVLTAYADVKSAIDSAKLGASDFISKPYDFDELLITIRKAIQREE